MIVFPVFQFMLAQSYITRIFLLTFVFLLIVRLVRGGK